MNTSLQDLKNILPFKVFQKLGLNQYSDLSITELDDPGVFQDILNAYHVDIVTISVSDRAGKIYQFSELNKLVQFMRFVNGCYGIIEGRQIRTIDQEPIQYIFREYNAFFNQCITWTYS